MNRRIAYPVIIVCSIIIIISWYFCFFNPVTTIMLVRHAEKAGGQNPPLTDEGKRRAGVLAYMLKDSGLDAIYVTEYLRTQQTADSVRLLLGISPVEIPRNDVDELVNHLKNDHPGETVLVVGHSTSVPEILQALGINSPPTIAETEFDNLFLVHRHKFGHITLTHLRYGKYLGATN